MLSSKSLPSMRIFVHRDAQTHLQREMKYIETTIERKETRIIGVLEQQVLIKNLQ